MGSAAMVTRTIIWASLAARLADIGALQEGESFAWMTQVVRRNNNHTIPAASDNDSQPIMTVDRDHIV